MNYGMNMEKVFMRKQISAILAAFVITGFIALCMTVVGANALVNKNSVPVSNSPQATVVASTTNDPSAAAAQTEIQQLEARINQYQQREQQYQQELQTAQQQIQTANSQIAQFQQLLQVMQQRGLIFIDQNGQIFLPGR
jgi:peptidoglycan hydrolase CwlO-like protein